MTNTHRSIEPLFNKNSGKIFRVTHCRSQEKTTFDLQKSIPVEPEKGWLLIVEEI